MLQRIMDFAYKYNYQDCECIIRTRHLGGQLLTIPLATYSSLPPSRMHDCLSGAKYILINIKLQPLLNHT